ncbi:MAG: ChbG/HpnK family deacetylase [Candidatus Aminicenantes bacterium]|nr:ChbG/HpnK family deacetylase [Candidatus Aminicenantes bacterium]
MARIIINADDFGLCACVNEGIIEAHRNGALSSATIMANMPGFDQAVVLAKENPRLGVGVHLNLVRGLPLSPASRIPTILGPDGRFLGSPSRLMRKMAAGRARPAEVEIELRAQIEKALAAGLRPSHVDSEKHMHAYPPVFRIAARLAGEYGIGGIRFIREFRLSRHPVQSAKAVLLTLWSARARAAVRSAGLVITDRFYGICNSGRMTAADLRRLIERPGRGSAEIMIHPGYVRPELFALEALTGPYYINRFREGELKAVTDPSVRALFRPGGPELTTYHGLRK